MRHRGEIEIFSLSFLDLISCAMGGIIVLYTITDSDTSRVRQKPSVTMVMVETSPLYDIAHYRFVLKNRTKTYAGTTMEPGSWAVSGATATLRLKEELATESTLIVVLLDHHLDATADGPPNRYGLKVRIVGGRATLPSREMSLDSVNHFQMEIPLR